MVVASRFQFPDFFNKVKMDYDIPLDNMIEQRLGYESGLPFKALRTIV